MHKYSNSLMIGATGMLTDAAAWVAQRSSRMVLVSRSAPRSPLANHPGVVALSADWRDGDKFFRAIARADGFIDTQLAVLWIHGNGAQAKRRVLQELSALDCLIVDIRGSAALTELDHPKGAIGGGRSTARHITVTLGSVPTAAGRRWLSWEEISTGVIDAIVAGESRVVGWLT